MHNTTTHFHSVFVLLVYLYASVHEQSSTFSWVYQKNADQVCPNHDRVAGRWVMGNSIDAVPSPAPTFSF